jgi:hypothetical protein
MSKHNEATATTTRTRKIPRTMPLKSDSKLR